MVILYDHAEMGKKTVFWDDDIEARRWLWEHRILPRLNKNAELGCWEWQGSVQKIGYGQIMFTMKDGRRNLLTHRVTLEVVLGRRLARNEFALHSCDNPRCCNPD